MEEDSILYEFILPKASILDEIPHMEYETTIIESAHKTANAKSKSAWSNLEQEIFLNKLISEKRLFAKFTFRWRKERDRTRMGSSCQAYK